MHSATYELPHRLHRRLFGPSCGSGLGYLLQCLTTALHLILAPRLDRRLVMPSLLGSSAYDDNERFIILHIKSRGRREIEIKSTREGGKLSEE